MLLNMCVYISSAAIPKRFNVTGSKNITMKHMQCNRQERGANTVYTCWCEGKRRD